MGMFAKIGEMMDKFAAEMNATVQGLPEDMVKVGVGAGAPGGGARL